MRRIKKITTASIATVAVLLVAVAFSWPVSCVPANPLLLDPKTIPKYVNQITGAPPAYVPEFSNATHEFYTVDMTSFRQQILPTGTPLAAGVDGWTNVWGYGGNIAGGYARNSPAPSFEATVGKEIYVRWQNKITGSQMFAVDPTLHWANPNNIPMMDAMAEAMAGLAPPFPPGYNGVPWPIPGTNPIQYANPNGWNAQSPVPLVPHLHGGEVRSTSDGGPEAWFTAGGQHGSAYYTELNTWWDGTPIQASEEVYHYPNTQQPTTLWYHDHALGITRINVMSGLAGFYLLRDPADTAARAGYIPPTQYEVPLAIQDRIFDINGELYFPNVGINPLDHPYWLPEFFGNTIMVNGLVWPNMNVKQGVYRFRLLDGSNARFYTLSFFIQNAKALGVKNKLPFTVIGTEGGYLRAPVTLTELTIAPGERYDILVDFSKVPIAAGTTSTSIIMQNTAKAPFPAGAPADPQTVGQIMQFSVQPVAGWMPTAPLPTILNTALATFPSLSGPIRTRQLTLTEVMGMNGPLEVLLDGKKWAADISENVTVGTTEQWIIVDATADAHPIHLHLTQFQLVSRQPFQSSKYLTDWYALNGMPPVPNSWTVLNPPLANYLQGKPRGPTPTEQGWKDTIQVFPGEVTIIIVRFAAQDGSAYPFDATFGPGYVWHCHIIDHEDNEMMRPYLVKP